jgi:hypothetical protein
MTSSKTQPKRLATAMQDWRAASRPGAPVAALALPALTRTAVTRPPVEARWRRPMVTGAATTWLAVKSAAAVAPVSQTARATSGLPLVLMPAVTEDQRKPRGRVVVSSIIDYKGNKSTCKFLYNRT